MCIRDSSKIIIHDRKGNLTEDDDEIDPCIMKDFFLSLIHIWPFWWWMRNASEVSLRAVSEADSPGVSKDAFKAIAEV